MPSHKRRSKAIETHTSAQRVHRNAQKDGHSDVPIAGRANAAPRQPIHSLPLEILSQIFIFALHIDLTVATPFNPLVLCMVCSSWRSLAFSTPQLWQRVFIHIPLRLKKAQDENRAVIIQWIERARLLPLALHIYCDYYHGDTERPNLKAPFLSVIKEYATHWKSLFFQDQFTALQLGPSPTLPPVLFQNGVLLRLLLQKGGLFHPVSPFIYQTFPWAEVTHVELHNHHDISCESILKNSPKLVQLSISVYSLCISSFGYTIRHNLVTLSLKMISGCEYLLDRLSLPSLRDLFLKQVSSEHVRPLLNLFTRSSCSLSKLEVYGQNLSPYGLLNVLSHRSCKSLKSLKILESCDFISSQEKRELVDDDVLRRLAFHQDYSLCPHLKFLTIDCAMECSLSALLKIVDSCLTDWQPPDDSIKYIYLRGIRHFNDVRKLDEVGKRSGMEYTRRKHRVDQCGQYFYSVLLQKQGLRRKELIVNHDGFYFDLDLV